MASVEQATAENLSCRNGLSSTNGDVIIRRGERCARLSCAGGPLFLLGLCGAKEQAEEFVAGLRERGLYELTLDYLSQMESSPLTDDAFKPRIAYLRGVTLIDEARQATDAGEQSKLLDRARAELDRFVAANPASADGAEAQTQLATCSSSRRSDLPTRRTSCRPGPPTPNRRDKGRAAARQLLDQAQSMFKTRGRFYTAAIDKLPKTPSRSAPGKQGDSRQDLRGRLAQVSVLAAQSQFEQAATYPPDTKKFRELNEAAAKAVVGLVRSVFEVAGWLLRSALRGALLSGAGDYQRAEGCFEEIISQSSVTPTFRKLISSAYGYQTECYVAQKKFDEAIAGAKAVARRCAWRRGSGAGVAAHCVPICGGNAGQGCRCRLDDRCRATQTARRGS